MIKRDLNENGRLEDEDIVKLINQHEVSEDVKKYNANEQYFKGKNPPIINRDKKDKDVPDNRVPIPYGRKISLTTKNYMFNRPIEYACEDNVYKEQLDDIFFINKNDKKVKDIGLDLIVHGASYKLFYVDDIGKTPVVRYTVIKGNELILIYSYDIEPDLIAAIRYYRKGTDTTDKYVEIYYSDKTLYYILKDNKTGDSKAIQGKELVLKRETVNPFPAVPIIAYGDEYQMGVFDAIKPIIDGIDIIISSDLNEVQRFELAYMVLKGQKMKRKDLKEAKEKRLFELDEKAMLEYLTKQVDGEFNGSVLAFLVAEAHKQSGVPDFASKEFAAESGIALLYKLMGFENLASDIEAIFIDGEERSVDMINAFLFRPKNVPMTILDKLDFRKKNPEKDIVITMTRNLPQNVLEKIQIAKGLKEVGVSNESVLEIIESLLKVGIETELKRQEDEKAAYVDLFQGSGETDDQEDDKDDNKDTKDNAA